MHKIVFATFVGVNYAPRW